jgi:hypothetical protein
MIEGRGSDREELKQEKARIAQPGRERKPLTFIRGKIRSGGMRLPVMAKEGEVGVPSMELIHGWRERKPTTLRRGKIWSGGCIHLLLMAKEGEAGEPSMELIHGWRERGV